MTDLGDITQGFHTLVIAYKSGANNHGTLTFYWDGVKKLTHTYSSDAKWFGIPSSPGGIQFNTLVSRGSYSSTGSKTFVYKSGIHSFYDFRFYTAQFDDNDAIAYAAHFPCTYPFRPDAYVESSGYSAIDTGYLAKQNATRYMVDYLYLSPLGQSRIFIAEGDLISALYVQGSKATGNLGWSMNGATWKGTGVSAGRLRRRAILDAVSKTVAITNYVECSNFYTSTTTMGTASTNATETTLLLAQRTSGGLPYWNNSKSRIYSFEIDESGAPQRFLVPATNDVGAAGLKDVLTGTFYGDANEAPERPLRFYNGVGSADDYKYEDATIYSKCYVHSSDAEKGTVNFGTDAAAASATAWVPYGTGMTLTATPAAGYVFAGWTGDTWLIAGGSTADAIVTVSGERAGQLRANFERSANPVSAYAQSGASEFIAHLDAIENLGAGMHFSGASSWTDLQGNLTLTRTGSAGFIGDAWKADGSSGFLTSSDAVKDALTAKTFTLELVVSHPSSQNQYEYWTFFGADSSHRQLVVDLRKDSTNPLVQGVQYRESSWAKDRSPVAVGTKTQWGIRQYITVVCDSTGATAYCNGTNQIHKTVGGNLSPSQNQISVGMCFDGTCPLYSGSEICAVRMTGRVLTEDERLRNWFVDSQRFNLQDSPDGYRFVDGAIEVRVTKGVPGFEFSTDGGTTWTADEVWTPINAEVTLTGRYIADPTVAVPFTGLPDGAVVSGSSTTFTPSRPYDISAGLPTLDVSGSAVWGEAAWQLGGASCTAPASGDAVINLAGNAVLTLDGDVALDTLELNGSGTLAIFTGSHTFSASAIDVPSGAKYVVCDGTDDGTVFWIGGESGNLGDATKWSTGVVPGPGTNAVITAAEEATLTNGAAFKATTIMFPVGSPKVTIEGEALVGIEAICNQSSTNHEFKAAVDADAIALNNTATYCVFTGGLTANSVSFGVADNTKAAIYGTWHIKGDWTPVKGNALYDGASVTVDGALLNSQNLSINADCVVTAATVRATGDCGYLTYYNVGRLVVTGLCDIATTVDTYLTRTETGGGSTVEFGAYHASTGSKWPRINAKDVIVGVGGIEADSSTVHFREAATLHPRTSSFELNSQGSGRYVTASSGMTIDTTQYETELPATVTVNSVFAYHSDSNPGKMTVTGCGTVVFNSVSTFTGGMTISDTATVAVNAGMVPGNGLVTVNAGATLAVAQSGTVALGGNLTLADGAVLGFNFTDKNTAPVLDVTDKTVTASGTVNVKVSAADGICPKGGNYTLTSGGKFAGATVDLVDRPKWAKSVSVDEGGNIVLSVIPRGIVVIVR